MQALSQKPDETILSCYTKESNPFRNITWLMYNYSSSEWDPIHNIQPAIIIVLIYYLFTKLITYLQTVAVASIGQEGTIAPPPHFSSASPRWVFLRSRP